MPDGDDDKSSSSGSSCISCITSSIITTTTTTSSAGPSFFLAQPPHKIAHREHSPHRHHHQDNLHRRQDSADVTTVVSASAVTEVSVTLNVVAQIDVNPNGSTFTVLTVPAEPTTTTNVTSQPLSTISPPLTAAVPVSSTILGGSPATHSSSHFNSTSSSPSSRQGIVLSSASTLSTPASASSHTGLTLPNVISNSTKIIVSSSSSSHTFANASSVASSSNSSLTYLTTSSGVLVLTSTPISDISSSSLSSLSSTSAYTSASTSLQTTATGFSGAAEGTSPPNSASSTAAASGKQGDSSSGISASTSRVVGGVVGSVAGVALIALIVIFVLKRWRSKQTGTGPLALLGDGRDAPEDSADVATVRSPAQSSREMMQRRSSAFIIPSTLAGWTGYRRSSKQTDHTTSSTAGSERGFHKVSGRKLTSVLQSGGDGWGDDARQNQILSGSSFYMDSQGIHGGPGLPDSPTQARHRESGQIGTPMLRPSPARTPITEQTPFDDVPPPPPPNPPSQRPVLTRSFVSQSSVHTSRFTEEV